MKRSPRPRAVSSARLCVALALCAALLASAAAPLSAQQRRIAIGGGAAAPAPTRKKTPAARPTQTAPPASNARARAARQDEQPAAGEAALEQSASDAPVRVVTADLMAQGKSFDASKPEGYLHPRMFLKRKKEKPLKQRERGEIPGALPLSRWPAGDKSDAANLPGKRLARPGRGAAAAAEGKADGPAQPSAPQTLGLQFDGATGPNETGAFPPDTMGAVGPTQFVVFINGRLRTFNKTTGAADGVLNVDTDVFFASVLTPPNAGEVVFTTDPMVRYDRLTGRWYLMMIDVPINATTGVTRSNRVLIAVSDAASSNALTGSTVWTLYQFVGDAARFTDYPSLGIDANALYIGGNQFSNTTGAFSNVRALIVPKAPTLTGAALTVFAANNLVNATAGPFSPRGVDNPDPANTGATATGYFIGVDLINFNRLTLRRVTNPGAVGGPPSISANLLVNTPLTTNVGPPVPHLGNLLLADTNGDGFPDGNLDGLDDRLYAAVIRNGRLWTAHNVGTNNAGVATANAPGGGATNDRQASRWYELQNLGTTPAVLQSGTLYDNSAATPRNYWIPSIAVSGQGHAAIGTSIAGSLERINAFTTGRLSGDTLGALRDGPGTPPGYTDTAATNVYNPPGDPGPIRRWGDYSFTSLDPLDDMTLWTIQEYCNGPNTYGVRVVRLIAPPPATPSSASNAVVAGQSSTSVTITGTAVNGSGFYDPGANPPAPHAPFNHIAATVSGGVTVNSVTYNGPTSITLNLNTTAAAPGTKDVTVTNPDGQSVTGTNVLTVSATAPAPGQALISEFRFRGSTGGNDEFVEIYNNSDAPVTVAASDGSAGWGVYGTNTTGTMSLRFTVPNGTEIPARGYYLGANSGASGYSLGAVAVPNATYTTGIVDGGGVALFTTATLANISAANRLDSVGFSGITGANTGLFSEGSALTPAGGITANGEYSFVRRLRTGLPQDTGNNADDFQFVATNAGVFDARQSALGAPGPQNLASPTQRNADIKASLIDPMQSAGAPPNSERKFCSPATPGVEECDPSRSQFGTFSIRRRWTNTTAVSVTQLRFRIVDVTTGPTPPAGTADLRGISSGQVTGVAVTGGGTVTVEGTTLEAPTQALGGGFNSTLAAGTVSLASPLAPGASVNLQFLLGVQQPGAYRIFVNVEALP